MFSLKNLKIRYKLVVLLTVPILSIFGLSIWGLKEKVRQYREISGIEEVSGFSVRASRLIHELQKERGLTAGYYGSQGKQFTSELRTQREQTNEKLSQFEAYFQHFKPEEYGVNFAKYISTARGHLRELDQKRMEADAMKVPVGTMIGYYTNCIQNLLTGIGQAVKNSGSSEIRTILFAYTSLMWEKENAGIERAVLSNTFAQDKFGNRMYIKFIALLTKQDDFRSLFLSFAPEKIKEYYRSELSNPVVSEAQSMEKVALAKANVGGFGIDPTHWFQIQTQKINLLKDVEDKVSEALMQKAHALKSAAANALFVGSVSVIGTLLLSLFLLFYITKGINDPLNNLMRVAKDIAKGDINQTILYKSRDEVGQLADSFREMMEVLHEKADVAEQISRGNLSQKIAVASDEDVLGNAMINMKKSIRLLIDDTKKLARNAIQGNLNVRADAEKHQGEFKEIIENTNELLDGIVAPLRELGKIFDSMAKGDLTQTIHTPFQGEYENIRLAANKAIHSLHETLSEVYHAVEQISIGSVQVSDASQSLSQGATEQASSLEELSSSMTQISSQTKQNAENAYQTNKLATVALNNAEKGKNKMGALDGAMEEINESSQKIKKVIKVIDEIAFQTNLLALNAAVEAARAGVHGKGFAVVADEVRNLSQRSAKAAKETAELIEDSVERVDNGMQLAKETSESLQEIVVSVMKVKDLVGEISSASSEQTEGIEQVNIGLSQIDQVTQQTASNAEETASASEELSGQARELKQMVLQFKLKGISGTGSTSRPSAARSSLAFNFASEEETPNAEGTGETTEWGTPPKEEGLGTALDQPGNVTPEDVISLDDDDFGRF